MCVDNSNNLLTKSKRGSTMDEITNLITQLISIKEQSNISIGQIMIRTDNKYSKPTITHLLTGLTANPNMETFIDVASAIGARVVIQTETSENAELTGNIEEYRVQIVELNDEIEKLRGEIEALRKELVDTRKYYKDKITDRDKDATQMRQMLDRKDAQVSTLIDACRRKDERLNELGIRLQFWKDKENK